MGPVVWPPGTRKRWEKPPCCAPRTPSGSHAAVGERFSNLQGSRFAYGPEFLSTTHARHDSDCATAAAVKRRTDTRKLQAVAERNLMHR